MFFVVYFLLEMESREQRGEFVYDMHPSANCIGVLNCPHLADIKIQSSKSGGGEMKSKRTSFANGKRNGASVSLH